MGATVAVVYSANIYVPSSSDGQNLVGGTESKLVHLQDCLVKLHILFPHIPRRLQLRGIDLRKVLTIADVMHSIEWCWKNSHILLSVINIHDFFIEVVLPYLKCLICSPHEFLTICIRGFL